MVAEAALNRGEGQAPARQGEDGPSPEATELALRVEDTGCQPPKRAMRPRRVFTLAELLACQDLKA